MTTDADDNNEQDVIDVKDNQPPQEGYSPSPPYGGDGSFGSPYGGGGSFGSPYGSYQPQYGQYGGYFNHAIDEVAKADPNNIQEVAASQLAIINSYYQSGLQQSQQSFRWSLIWGGIGLGFLIVAVSVLLFRQPAEVAVASGIGGAIVEVFASTYLYLYKHASDQLAAFRASLESTQRFLLANSMTEMLEGKIKQTIRAEIIHQMVNNNVNSQELIPMDKDKKA